MPQWDHNRHYHPLLLRQLPPSPRRVADVGCGAGELAVALAARADQVVALDRDQAMVDAATSAARGAGRSNVEIRRADIRDAPLSGERYDAVLSLSAMHHLTREELQPVLTHLASALAPGGLLAVIALPRVDLPRELPVELTALACQHTYGTIRSARDRAESSNSEHAPPRPGAATRAPVLTTREVRDLASAVLPGVRVDRLLMWRYLLTWHRAARS